jgi:hypothetical protein
MLILFESAFYVEIDYVLFTKSTQTTETFICGNPFMCKDLLVSIYNLHFVWLRLSSLYHKYFDFSVEHFSECLLILTLWALKKTVHYFL